VQEKIFALEKLEDLEILEHDEVQKIKNRYLNDGEGDENTETYTQYLDYLYDL